MGAKRETELPAELKKVRRELEEWRGRRNKGKRIPEELWDAAVRAARRHGLNCVSQTLGLDYSHLKRRLGLGKKKGSHAAGAEPIFVELANTSATVAEPNAACVELEKGNGVRMRICVRDAATVDWNRMKEAFLGA
ncbi:MAG: hypothetical protein HQ592_02295 [Planctomycetes bacterium]|nr:hypothetical protein [Planctomycetota bacterium]